MNFLAQIPRQLPDVFTFEYDQCAIGLEEFDRHQASLQQFIKTLIDLGYTVHSWRDPSDFVHKFKAVKQ